jgi:NTE family protein
MTRQVHLLFLIALLFPPDTFAQTQPEAAGQPQRPRIGLALGGGSARGIAHIGVLEWFEQHHVPIDAIVGTSMGGLIAGAYASGMTPAEIRELMRETDWDIMFLADSPFRYKTFRRKQDRRAYPAQLEFGLKGGFRMPSGLNPGQQVALLLDRIAAPYSELASFDVLPTPFRCVATDLKSGQAVVLGRGSLSQAMRATMAIPGVFTPVSFDDWLLVDGGALNNIPADVVRAMGVDIVIAVNVGADSAETEEQVQSLFALLGRTIDTMMTVGTRRALESADIVVDPDLKGLGSTDWRRSDDLAARGRAAAEAQADRLSKYALAPEAHAEFQAARQGRRQTTLPTPMFVETRGLLGDLTPSMRRVLERQFQPELGRQLDLDRMSGQVLTVAGTDRFEYVTFGQVERQNETGLLIGARPKSYGPPFLALGLELSNVDSTNFAVNLGGRITTYDIIGSGSEGRLDLNLGTELLAAGELYRPFGRSGFFVAPRAYFNRYGRNGYLDDRFVAEYRVKRMGAGLDLGYTTGHRSEIRAGVDFSDLRGRVRVGDPQLPEVEGGEGSARLQFTYDAQTSPIVPSRGLYVRSTLRYYFDMADITTTQVGGQPLPVHPEKITQGEVNGTWFRRGAGEDRIFIGLGGGTSFGDRPLYNDFALGGLLRLGAFNNDQLRGSNYGYVNAGYLRQVSRLSDVIGGNMYLGGWLESGSAWNDWDEKDWHNNVTGGLIVESLIGPIFAGVSADVNRFRYYVAIGPLFK